MNTYIPCTPAGTPCMDLESNTEEEAWAKVQKHMPYRNREALVARGYTVCEFTNPES